MLKTESIGKYGQLRLQFLKHTKPVYYQQLVTSGELYGHLENINKFATKEVDRIVNDMVKSKPPPDKSLDGEGWVKHMNTLKLQAEELVINTLICV